MAEHLKCDVVPIVYSDTSSTITVRTVTEIIKQFDESGAGGECIHSVLFRSILNYREYELVDREVGRQTSIISLGSIPRSLEREHPPIADLCSGNAAQKVFPTKSAITQIKSSGQMINWGLFSALAQTGQDWKPQARLCEQITDAGKVNIAVVRNPALMLGGDGTEHLMRALGCNVVEVPLEGDVSHNVPIHGVYVPHGLTFLVLEKFFKNLYLKTMLTRGSTGNSFLLVEGGSTPILGDRIVFPPGFDDEEGRGFNILPYDSAYKAMSMGAPRRMTAASRKANPMITGSQEILCGYLPSNISIASPDSSDECWTLRENPRGNESGTDAWCKGRALASRMRIEPWSAPESFRRWLEG
jgi:cobyrinic acid a,c-diamide synthase